MGGAVDVGAKDTCIARGDGARRVEPDEATSSETTDSLDAEGASRAGLQNHQASADDGAKLITESAYPGG